ncbi:uncharacterized protein METZ01_LOCUS68200 [marine metagenome]|uniref:Uncharacterized protein n=1 Tax=marine metagenome TaxID=408172 RepID=A0A381TGW6_9ZZZZ
MAHQLAVDGADTAEADAACHVTLEAELGSNIID